MNTLLFMTRTWFVSALCIGLCLTAAQAQTNALDALKSRYEMKRKAINDELQKKNHLAGQEYAADLKKVLQTVQKSGDFDGYVFIEKELERFTATPIVGSALDSPLLKAPILAYQQKTNRSDSEADVKRISLDQQYLDALIALRKELMLQNKMKEASEVNELAKKTEAHIKFYKERQASGANSATPPAPPPTKLDSLFEDEPAAVKPSSGEGETVKTATTGKKSKKGPAEAVEWNGHFYLFYPERVKWDSAKLKCQSRGGYLVAIGNREENDFVASLIEGKTAVWIGLYKSVDTWKWMNLETVGYMNWSSGKPSITKRSPRMGVGTCAFMRAVERYINSTYVDGVYKRGHTEVSGVWDDAYTDAEVEGYLCEWNE